MSISNYMLKKADTVLCYLITGLGVVFLAITPVFAGSFLSRGGVEFMGAVLFLVFLGLLNLARVKSRHPSARTLAILGNAIALAYLVLVSIVLRDPAVIGVILPVLALSYTSWVNPIRENSKPLTAT
jgi:hypothetical protein